MVAGAPRHVAWVPARVWLEALAKGTRMAILALLDDADRAELVLAVARGELAADELTRAGRELLSAETGRKWWVAEMLSAPGEEMLGELVLSGVDPDRVSIGEWTAATYRILTRNLDEKGRIKLDFELSIPPAGHSGEWEEGSSDAGFAEMEALERRMMEERRAQRGK